MTIVGSIIFLSLSMFASLDEMKVSEELLSKSALALCSQPCCSTVAMQVPRIETSEPEVVLQIGGWLKLVRLPAVVRSNVLV